jgi:xanthosine utilization system XapX-like protein
MGPLFSALVLGLSTLGAFALAYAVARFFQPASAAVRMAAVFILGSAVGGNAIALALSIFVRSTLTESWQVIAYLLSLGLGALASGAALLVFCIKRRVLTLRSSGPPQAASA